MKFNYWNYTTCVLCNNLDPIELALTQILKLWAEKLTGTILIINRIST
jgi:hypothetical protein